MAGGGLRSLVSRHRFLFADCVTRYAFSQNKKAGDIVKYTPEEVMQFVQQEEIKFIRLAFCDVYGKQHNVAIMPSELKRAFAFGIAIDASAIDGFGGEIRSDLLLHPDASTLIQLPWRPEQGTECCRFLSNLNMNQP